MRRFFYWYLPLVIALAASALFALGFYSFMRGDIGTPVNLLPPRSAPLPLSLQTGSIAPIILGDSLARGTGDTAGLGIGGRLDLELRRRNIRASRTINIAVNGARTADLLRQIQSRNVQTILGQSSVIIISIGGNDLWGGDARNAALKNPDATMNAVLDRMVKVVDAVRKTNARARIFIIGLYNPFASTPLGAVLTPLVNRWNAKLIDRFSGDVNITVVQTADIFTAHDRLSFDRFHPSDEGYSLIARRIADAI